VSPVAALPDGRVVTGSEDGVLPVWDLTIGKTVRSVAGYAGPVYAVAALPDGRVIFGSNGSLRVLDLATGEIVHTLEGHLGAVFARRKRASVHWLGRISRRNPTLFVLWTLGAQPEAGS
jgi:WD40 repeat protein